MHLKTLANTPIRRETSRLNTRIVVLCVSFAHAGGGLNQRICDVNGQYVRCSGAPDCPTYPMGCGGALVRQHTPTSSHNHRPRCAVGVVGVGGSGGEYDRYETFHGHISTGYGPDGWS